MSGISSTRPIIFESYAPQVDSISAISFGSGVLTNITNVSGIGILCSVAIRMESSVPGVTANLEIQIDGGTTKLITLLVAGVLGQIMPFSADGFGTSTYFFMIPVGSRFAVSCRVGVNVTVASGATTYTATVCRAMKL